MFQLFYITLLFIHFSSKLSKSLQNCPSDWFGFSESCFKIFTGNSISMQRARQTCHDNGAELASVHSADENALLIRLLGTPSNNASSPSVFYIGLFISRRFLGLQPEALWSDGSPVDFFNGTEDSLLDHTWADGHFYWPKNSENSSSFGNCVLMGQGQQRWMDTRCDTPAQGFVCKKVPAQNSPILSYGNTMATLSILSLCSQAYVIWLIIAKSPDIMSNYRFYLCGTTIFDAIASFAIGMLIIPDIWQPYSLACSVNGLAKYLGAEGGRISLCIAEFAVIGQALFQLLSLLFRYTSVMEHQHARFHSLIIRKWALLVQIGIVCSLSALLVLSAFPMMDSPKDLPGYMWTLYNGVSQKMYSDARLANVPLITLNPVEMLRAFCIFSAVFCSFCPFSICLIIRIILYLRANAKLFSKRTFQLQIQLIISLLVQQILPLVFIGFPVLATFLATFFVLPPISKSTSQFAVFLFELYGFANPLTVVLFVSPFRRHTARICGFYALRKILFPTAPIDNKFIGNQQIVTTIVAPRESFISPSKDNKFIGNQQIVTTIVVPRQSFISPSKCQNTKRQDRQKRQNPHDRGQIQSAMVKKNTESEIIRAINPQKRSMSLKF